jgi:hypothetical protein
MKNDVATSSFQLKEKLRIHFEARPETLGMFDRDGPFTL